VLVLVVVPWLGALVYLIVRGRAMNERALEPSTADELAKLADLRDRGVISPEEFAQAKAHLLGAPASGTTNSPLLQGASIG
jgi:Short C-terminal domain